MAIEKIYVIPTDMSDKALAQQLGLVVCERRDGKCILEYEDSPGVLAAIIFIEKGTGRHLVEIKSFKAQHVAEELLVEAEA